MSDSDVFKDAEQTGFDLKRTGDFTGALRSYATECVHAAERGNLFIAEVCVEQLFDVALLRRAAERESYDSLATLEASVADEVKKVIAAVGGEALDLSESLERCRRMLSTGRGKSPYSIDPKRLIPSRRRRHQDNSDRNDGSFAIAEERGKYGK